MTERKRDVRFALMDAAFAADRKFIRLARMAPEPKDFAAAVGAFWLILADARRSKSPTVDFTEYTEYEEQVALLREVGLLTATGFKQATFDKWAPAYRSPWDERRVREGTPGYARVQSGTPTSSHVKSSHVTSNGEGGVGETPPTFMGWRPKDPEGGAGLWNGKGTHDGRHGKACAVCSPVLISEKDGAA